MKHLWLPALLAAGVITGFFARGAAEPPAKKVDTADYNIPAPKDGNYLGIRLAHDDPAADLRLIRKKINQVEAQIIRTQPVPANQPPPMRDEPDHKHHRQAIEEKLEQLHQRARVLVKQGNERALMIVKRQIEALNEELARARKEHPHGDHEHEGDPDDGHHHHHGGIEKRVKHLQAAAEHMAAAGYHKQAKEIAREAEALAAKHNHDDRFEAIMEAIGDLRREVRQLRMEVRGRKNRVEPDPPKPVDEPDEGPKGENPRTDPDPGPKENPRAFDPPPRPRKPPMEAIPLPDPAADPLFQPAPALVPTPFPVK